MQHYTVNLRVAGTPPRACRGTDDRLVSRDRHQPEAPLSGDCRCHRGRYPGRPAGSGRQAAAPAPAGRPAGGGFHHRRARLCGGAEAWPDRLDRRAGHLCPRRLAPHRHHRCRRDGPPGAAAARCRRSLDEPAAGAGHRGVARPHARRPRRGQPGSRRPPALSGLWRQSGGQGCRIVLARPAGAGAGAGAGLRHARRASGAAGHPVLSRPAGGCDPVGGHHLSRYPRPRRADGPDAGRIADG